MDTITRLETLMSQSDHTDEDITELARIRRHLSKKAKQTDMKANEMEEEYNLSRGREFVKVKKSKRGDGKYYTDKEADRIAKDRSEESFGKYRSMKAEAKGMYASLDALRQYIITLQSKKKNEIDASGYDIDREARKWPIQ